MTDKVHWMEFSMDLSLSLEQILPSSAEPISPFLLFGLHLVLLCLSPAFFFSGGAGGEKKLL